jgi:hypothetical protein
MEPTLTTGGPARAEPPGDATGSPLAPPLATSPSFTGVAPRPAAAPDRAGPAQRPASRPRSTAQPAWLHSPIELPLLMLLRQRLQQQVDMAASLRPAPAGPAPDLRGVAAAPAAPLPWQPTRPAGDARAARAALSRMAEGRYGWCQRCGQAIGRDRLLAQPTATTCEGCATGRADEPVGLSPDTPSQAGREPGRI